MIDRVHFENFKSLKDVTIDLDRLTVLVGANGSGKSSVLNGTLLLSRMGLRRPDRLDRFSGAFRSSYEPMRIANDREKSLVFSMHGQGQGEFTLHIQTVLADVDPEDRSLRFDLTLSDECGPQIDTHVQSPPASVREALDASGEFLAPSEDAVLLDNPRIRRFGSAAYLHLDARKMERESSSQSEEPRMGADGSMLASTLAWMKGAAEEELAAITDDLRKVVPGVKRIRTRRVSRTVRDVEEHTLDDQTVYVPKDKKVVLDAFELEFDSGRAVLSQLLSEGTVLALGLLTKLHEPNRPRLVLLDDIDRGLHVEAQGKLMKVLRDLLATQPDLQIVCTTHSPDLVSCCEASEVRVLALDENRCTQVRKLTEHPDFEKWKYGTQTGELWAALGESWVTKPPKAAAAE